MALSASQVYNKIVEYKNLKEKLNSTKASIESCQENISNAKQYVENIIISGKPVDDGTVSSLKDSLSNMLDIINTGITECNEKISTYQEMYDRMTKNIVVDNNSGSKPLLPPNTSNTHVMLKE